VSAWDLRPYEDVIAAWESMSGERLSPTRCRDIVAIAVAKIRRRIERAWLEKKAS